MLLLGIDEAGYGPLLGPLCHGLCVLRVPEGGPADRPPDLWERLAPAVSRHPAPAGAFAVDDSKLIHAGLGKLARLGHSVAAFLQCVAATADASGNGQAGMLRRLLAPEDLLRMETDAWGRLAERLTGEVEEDLSWSGPGPAALQGLRLRLKQTGTEVLCYGARALAAGDFNARLGVLGNKAEVNWERAAALLRQGAALARPGERLHAVIDRQGGRKFYGPKLMELFGGAWVYTEAERPERSAYRLEFDAREVRVEFREKAESHALPVALASLAAKLARELVLARLNAYFRALDATLAPTAGYYTDAQRFLGQTEALRRKHGIADERFIRRS